MGCTLAQILPFLMIVGFVGLVIGWLLRGGCEQKILVNDKNWNLKLIDINNRLEKKAKAIAKEKDSELKQKNKKISELQSKVDILRDKANHIDSDWIEKYTKLKSGYDLLLIENKGCESSMQDQEDKYENAIAILNRKLKDSKSKIKELNALLDSSKKDKNPDVVDISPVPKLLKEPVNGKKDNLTLIKGIGIVLENKLNDLGIFHFSQIASWTQTQIDWMDLKVPFPGRIKREKWVEQAKKLADGDETEFSKRVKKGDVPSSKKR